MTEPSEVHETPQNELPFDGPRHPLGGIGGSLKDEPSDFIVEEIPAYEPSGEGEHLFLWIEKSDRSHEQMTWQIGRALEIRAADIGVAGIKDRRAVTRQYVSVPAKSEANIAKIDGGGIRVLRAARHRNKLKRGHLRGNRFAILLRGTPGGALERGSTIVERIRSLGFPNYFGPQRFGVDGSTLDLGLDLLAGRQTPRDIAPSRRRFLLNLALSSVQSHLFNAYVAQRILAGSLRTVLPGDVMLVTVSGGRFVVDDVEREQARLAAGEVAISGPIFGPDMLDPRGEAAERETALLAAHGLGRSAFEQFARLTPGTRRAVVAFAEDLGLEPTDAGLLVRMSLPSGVYATSLLRELQ